MTLKWTQEEIEFLANNKNKSNYELSILLNRSESSISHKKSRTNNITHFRWSEEELEILKNNYATKSIIELIQLLPNRHHVTIIAKANKLNLHILDKRKINYLLCNDLESFYWIGFILADGWISKNKNSLGISLSKKDAEHLNKLGKYINIIPRNYTRKTKYSEKFEYVNITINDNINIPKICEKFDIQLRKTYNPPDFSKYNFADEQMLSLIIGFIDGDGSISKRLNSKSSLLSLQINESWKENLNFINNFLHNYFNQKNKCRLRHGTRDVNTVILQLSKSKLLHGIKDFIYNNSLPALKRKWDKIHN